MLLERVASWLERVASRVPEDSELLVCSFALFAAYVVIVAYAVDRVLETLAGLARSLACKLELLLLLLLLGSEGFAVRKGWLATLHPFLAERSPVSRLCRHYYLRCWLRGRIKCLN